LPVRAAGQPNGEHTSASTKASAMKGIESVRRNAFDAALDDRT
jgi:hypothetical protein